MRDLCLFGFRVVMGICEHHGVAPLGGFHFDILGELGKERVGDIRHHEADHVDAVGTQSPGSQVGLVVQLLHSREHTLLQGLLDRLVFGQNAGDSTNGHTGFACDVFDCWHVLRFSPRPRRCPP